VINPGSYTFFFEFEHNNTKYIARVIPVEELSPEQLSLCSIKEGSFVVELFSIDAIRMFEVFIGTNLEWQTNVSDIAVDKALVEIIGCEIDRRWS
jgi:hypothetical protein